MKKLLFFTLSAVLYACNAPYSLDKFKEVLNNSKLQAPISKFDSLYSTKYGKFNNVCNKYFYLQDGKYMVFYMCEKNKNEHKRSELRFKFDFKVNENHFLKARIKILPLNEEKEFTFLQIHADSHCKKTPDKPLLRIVWRKKYKNIRNHLWAIITLENGYLKIDLGKKPKDFFDIMIEIKDSKLLIFINNEKKFDINVNYWKFYNYFKAGVYLQGRGCAKVLFDKLEVK